MADVRTIMQQAESHAIEDRIRLAAERIYSDRKVPDPVICEAISTQVTESEWLKDMCAGTLTRPLLDIFLGCILFGYKLCEESNALKRDNQIVFRA